jgi:hypothetical protein
MQIVTVFDFQIAMRQSLQPFEQLTFGEIADEPEAHG